jgi:hypothetical protein
MHIMTKPTPAHFYQAFKYVAWLSLVDTRCVRTIFDAKVPVPYSFLVHCEDKLAQVLHDIALFLEREGKPGRKSLTRVSKKECTGKEITMMMATASGTQRI